MGLVPTRSGTSRIVTTVDLHRPVAGVGPGVGVELERGLGGGKGRWRAPVCRAQSSPHRPRTRPSRPRAAAQWRRTPGRTGGRSNAPASTIASRLSVMTSTSRLRSNRRASSSRRPTASRVPRAATADRLLATRLTARNANKRDPVLRVGNRQGPDRRQEEEVEAEHRDDRRRDGDPQARRGGDEEDDQQEGRRHGRRVRHLQPPRVDERHRRDGADSGRQPSRVYRSSGHAAP